MLRQYLLRFSMLIPLIGGLMVLAFSALPSSTAFACLPCNCTTHRSVNCFGPYALYTPTEKDETCSLDIWSIEADGQGKRAIKLTADDLADLPAADEIENYVMVESAKNDFITLYKLNSGQYQINVGPDSEGKVYVIDFTGCPANDVTESTFVVGQ
ncbi:MAG: hypothetical protein ABI700_24845 [Chloroflexota bacterium]